MSAPDLVETWDGYYEEHDQTALKDRHLFELEVGAILDAVRELAPPPARILELGSGTGALAAQLIAAAPGCEYVGVDFSAVACERARARGLPGARFEQRDFAAHLTDDETRYDLIVTQRSVMAILERDAQRALLALMRARLTPTGVGLLSEGAQGALGRLNEARAQLGLGPLETVWHSHYLHEEDIEEAFGAVEARDFASLYWLITRVLYPHFEPPQHNQPIHAFAASLPQVGRFGLVQLFVVRP